VFHVDQQRRIDSGSCVDAQPANAALLFWLCQLRRGRGVPAVSRMATAAKSWRYAFIVCADGCTMAVIKTACSRTSLGVGSHCHGSRPMRRDERRRCAANEPLRYDRQRLRSATPQAVALLPDIRIGIGEQPCAQQLSPSRRRWPTCWGVPRLASQATSTGTGQTPRHAPPSMACRRLSFSSS
jgi:hypothetical protein